MLSVSRVGLSRTPNVHELARSISSHLFTCLACAPLGHVEGGVPSGPRRGSRRDDHLLCPRRPLVTVGSTAYHAIFGGSEWRPSNNVREWKTVPLDCKRYMLSHLYREERETLIDEAMKCVSAAQSQRPCWRSWVNGRHWWGHCKHFLRRARWFHPSNQCYVKSVPSKLFF